MNYEYPTIITIDPFLKAIKGRDEFVHVQKEDYQVLNYVYATNDSFNIEPEGRLIADSLGEFHPVGVYLRECRGLIFSNSGVLISRPFHKFFNVGEREETLPKNINLSRKHRIFEKMDGSMIRPFLVNGHMRLGSKMGITDTSMQAETWLADYPELQKELLRHVLNGWTPLLEWTSPKNQIVVEYPEERLYWLCARRMNTGEYTLGYSGGFTQAPSYGSYDGSIDDFVSKEREGESREGSIIYFGNHMVKVKNDWYVKLHKVKDQIRTERHIVRLILDDGLDDLFPLLDKPTAERVEGFQKTFLDLCARKRFELEAWAERLVDRYDRDRKRIALEGLQNVDKMSKKYVFGLLDGKNIREMFWKDIENHLSTEQKYQTFMEWLKDESSHVF